MVLCILLFITGVAGTAAPQSGPIPVAKDTRLGYHGTDAHQITILDENGEKVFETRLFAQASGREIVFIGPPKKEGGLPSVRFLPQLLPQKLPPIPAQ